MKFSPIASAFILSLSALTINTATAATAAPTSPISASNERITNTLTDVQHQNLELLGKVWGFLKYHHPAIASGKYDWDKELIDRLPAFLTLKTVAARNQFLISWIDELGSIDLCTRCKPTREDAVLKPDHRWIYQTELPNNLRSRITFIYNNRHQGDQYYVKVSAIGSPEFINEKNYKALVAPNEYYRILTLFRFWNMIEYFSPHKGITDKEWSRVLGEYIPKVFEATVPLNYQTHLAHLIADLDDGHALMGNLTLFHRSKGVNFPRFKTAFIGDRLVVTKLYDNDIKTNPVLVRGDEILAINNVPLSDIISRLLPMTASSTKQGKMAWIAQEVLRSNDEQLMVTFKRGGKSYSKTVPLYDVRQTGMYNPPKKQPVGYHIISGNIGYVDLNKIKVNDVSAIKEVFKETNGIVIDLRTYPKFVVKELGGWFVQKKTPIANFTSFNINNPGEIVNYTTDYLEPQDEHYDRTIAVLVNENSSSLPEYTAQALRAAPNTTIIGRTTAGSDGDITRMILPGNIFSGFSGMGVFYPDGKPTQRIGIVPDIIVERTIEGIKAGKDEVLDVAVEFLVNRHQKELNKRQ